MRFARAAALLGLLLAGCGDDSADEPPSTCGQGRVCDCEPGDTRAECNPCRQGYRPALVGPDCVPTCNAVDVDCGEHGVCEETAGGAECRCDPGHTGADCESCVAGLARNQAGQCVAALSAPSLLTLSVVDGERVLGALVPPGWSFEPLTAVPNTVTDVAYDAVEGQVYVLSDGRLGTLDLGSGAIEELTNGDVDLGSSLCLDPAGQRALGSSAESIHQVDLDSLEVEEVAAVGAVALEYDPGRAKILGVDEDLATFELSASTIELAGRLPDSDWLAMAFDPERARAYFLGSEAESREDRLARYCTAVLTRFGAVPAWQSRIVIDPEGEDTAPFVLGYQGADPALLILDLGTDALDSVRIDVEHPDAAVCIVDDESSGSEIKIELSERTRAGFLVVDTPGRAVSVDATARPSEASYSFAVHTDDGLSVSGSSAGITEYDTESWSRLALESFVVFPERPRASLLLMDWASQATFELPLSHEPVGRALAWVGEVP
jgi:hypothetical protein